MFAMIQDNNKKMRANNEIKKKSIVLRKASLNPNAAALADPEKKQEHKYMLLSSKIDKLTRIVEDQHEIIMELRNEIRKKIGMSKASTRNINQIPDNTSHDFSSENSNTSMFKAKYLGNRKSMQSNKMLKKFSAPKNTNVGSSRFIYLEIMKYQDSTQRR